MRLAYQWFRNISLQPGSDIRNGSVYARRAQATHLVIGWRKGQISISTWTGQLWRSRKCNGVNPECSRQEVVPPAAFSSWRESSGYSEHSERASSWWTGWKRAEIMRGKKRKDNMQLCWNGGSICPASAFTYHRSRCGRPFTLTKPNQKHEAQ